MQINISSSGIIHTLLSTLNNTSNEKSTDGYLSEPTQQVFGTVFCVFSVLGVAANITVLKMVLTNRHQLNSSTVFIPALAVIGFIISAFFIPLHAAAAFRRSLTFNQSECMFYKFVFNLIGLLFSTLLTVMVVQTYRLIVSVHSSKAGFDKGRVVLVLAGCILVCGIVAALPFVGTADYTPYSRPMLCHIRWIPFDHANIAYFTSIAIVFFVLPSVLISTIYASIYFKKIGIDTNSSDIINIFLTTVNTTWYNTSNEKSTDDVLSEPSQQIIGTVICVVSIFGVAANLTVLKMVKTNRHQLNSSAVFIPILAVLGFVVSAIFLPLDAAAALEEGIAFNQSECMFYKFVFTSIGLLFSTLLTVMVVQTYRLIVCVHSAREEFDRSRVAIVLAGCVIVCGIVAAIPFVGVTDYSPYRRPLLCHLRWIQFDHADVVYFTSLAIVFFVLPTIVISTLYALIYLKTKKSLLKSSSSTRSKHRHIFMLKTFLIITVAFILTWSPYVICIALDLGGVDYRSYSLLIYLICSMVAKVSLSWIPVIFVIRHSHYKKQLDILTNDVIEKVGHVTMSSAEYILHSTDRAVDREIAVEMDLIPSKPVLLSYSTSDDAL